MLLISIEELNMLFLEDKNEVENVGISLPKK